MSIENICTRCGKPIVKGEPLVKGSTGDMHYRCFKVGKMHGQRVEIPRCPNCSAPLFRGDTCHQCGVSERIGP